MWLRGIWARTQCIKKGTVFIGFSRKVVKIKIGLQVNCVLSWNMKAYHKFPVQSTSYFIIERTPFDAFDAFDDVLMFMKLFNTVLDYKRIKHSVLRFIEV